MMTTLNELKTLLSENASYDDEMIIVAGYGKMKYNQVNKLALEQLESAIKFTKQQRWEQAQKQIEMFDVFAKAAAKAKRAFEKS